MREEAAIIVGAGPIGLACAISAKRRGIDALVIDAGAVANSIVRYPINMTFFTTPERLEIGDHPLVCAGAKATREEALKYYRGVVRAENIRVQTYAKLGGVRRTDHGFDCDIQTRTGAERTQAQKLVLATGYFDHPNRLSVPGEELPHVRHYFDEAHLSYGRDVVVIGGKNSAVEAALQLFRAGARTTIIYRGTTWPKSVKYWLRPDLENRIEAGEIAARLGSQVVEITPRDVLVRGALGNEERIPADKVYPLIGFHPDLELFKRIGIAFDPESGRPQINAETLETNVPGMYVAGSVTAGTKISEIFIENGRFDGEKIFGSLSERKRAQNLYQGIRRETGE
ncbi:MAG TPA: YpdA family putative bacillithiol disulfide reductase [Gemmatimonadales bacterium]|jgi:thioredoxin reductase (NADPH)|nr:YpdA family putative bacillithiol disulfide reductase [Gemmatimonadales bacterium]